MPDTDLPSDTDASFDAPVMPPPTPAHLSDALQPKADDVHPEDPTASVLVESMPRAYPSLYDSRSTTVVAVFLGLVIVGGIQYLVHRIHRESRTQHGALTRFVTMMVALVLGAYMADLLIAGPQTSLLDDEEHRTILGFVKDICLMVFSYYFGTRANAASDD